MVINLLDGFSYIRCTDYVRQCFLLRTHLIGEFHVLSRYVKLYRLLPSNYTKI